VAYVWGTREPIAIHNVPMYWNQINYYEPTCSPPLGGSLSSLQVLEQKSTSTEILFVVLLLAMLHLLVVVFAYVNHQIIAFMPAVSKALAQLARGERTGLMMMSYGDPDRGQEWTTTRRLQEGANRYDKLLYPYEGGVPGVIFPSVVEWAPWMDTIWFGNIYEYRTAYFQGGCALYRGRE